MALYTMGDLHLSFAPGLDKPMDIFGRKWEDHASKIRENWCLKDSDTIVLPGDLSWAIDFNELEHDLAFVDALPGTKILLKGNHDYWWTTMKKMSVLTEKYKSIKFLHNNSYLVDGIAICGTRGWIAEPDAPADEKVLNRECGRLRMSLASAKEGEKTVFLHYPPVFADIRCDEIMDILLENGIKTCYYGHLHGPSHRLAVNGKREGIDFHLISADFLNFTPFKIT
ncbi:MAG: metallophosphoesterase [Eubacteriales bacterium]